MEDKRGAAEQIRKARKNKRQEREFFGAGNTAEDQSTNNKASINASKGEFELKAETDPKIKVKLKPTLKTKKIIPEQTNDIKKSADGKKELEEKKPTSPFAEEDADMLLSAAGFTGESEDPRPKIEPEENKKPEEKKMARIRLPKVGDVRDEEVRKKLLRNGLKAEDNLIRLKEMKANGEKKENLAKKISNENGIAWEDFQEKYKSHYDFINQKEDYFDNEDNWIHFVSYDGKKAEIDLRDSKIGGARRKVNLAEFDELLKKYKKKVLDEEKKKMEDVEKGRAKTAQEDIDKEKFDYYRDPKGKKKEEPEEKKEEENILTPIEEKDFNKNPDDVVEMKETETGKWEMNEEKYPLEIIKNTEEERAEKIEQIKAELELARKEYLEVDYKKNKAYSRLYKFFGRAFGNKNNKEKNFENDQDIAWYRAHYDNKLMDLKNALLEDAKARGINNKELGEIVKIFEAEARINMSDGHDQVKIENHEGRISGFIKNHSQEIIERYKKLPLAKKIAIGAAFGLGALGAGVTGSAIAIGTVASAATIRRAFMAMVTGTSAALYAESKTQKNREKAVEKETSQFVDNIEGLSPELIEQIFQSKINNLIYDEDQKINTIKNKNLRNLGIGVGVGAFSAIAVPQIFKYGKEWLGFGPKVSELSGIGGKDIHSHIAGGGAQDTNIPGNGAGAGNIHEHAAGAKIPAGETYTENTHPSGASPESVGKMEIPKEKILTVEKYHTGKSGGTFEGTIKKYLIDEQKMGKIKAGKLATILRQQWESLHPNDHHYDLVHVGDQIKIEIGADGQPQISGFEEASNHLGSGPISGADDFPEVRAVPEVSGGINNLENERIFSADQFPEVKSVAPPNLPGASAENPFNYENAAVGAALSAAAIGSVRMAKDKGKENKENSNKVIDFPDKRKRKEMAKDRMIKNYNFNRNDDFYLRARKIIKILSLEKLNNWKKIKDVKFRDWENDESLIEPKLARIIKEMENNLAEVLGRSGKHKNNKKETIGKWVARISDYSVRKQMI